MRNFTHSHAAVASQQRHDTRQPIECKPSTAECRRCVCGADTQESDRACLKVNNPTSFITLPSGQNSIEFHHTADDADRHIRAHLTTILGSLRCHSDIQLADTKALLLKYVNSYITKMHESATSEGLYCNDVTGTRPPTHSHGRSLLLSQRWSSSWRVRKSAGQTKWLSYSDHPSLPWPTPIKCTSYTCNDREWKMTSPSSPGCALITPPPTSRKRMTGTDTWQESSTFQFLIPSTSISIWLCITLIAPPTSCAI